MLSSAQLKLPAFTIYQEICDAFEDIGNVTEAIEWFQKMTNELENDMIMQQERWYLVSCCIR